MAEAPQQQQQQLEEEEEEEQQSSEEAPDTNEGSEDSKEEVPVTPRRPLLSMRSMSSVDPDDDSPNMIVYRKVGDKIKKKKHLLRLNIWNFGNICLKVNKRGEQMYS